MKKSERKSKEYDYFHTESTSMLKKSLAALQTVSHRLSVFSDESAYQAKPELIKL